MKLTLLNHALFSILVAIAIVLFVGASRSMLRRNRKQRENQKYRRAK